jgi:hypothetical protein
MPDKAGTNYNNTFCCGRFFLYIFLVLVRPQEMDVLAFNSRNIWLENFTSSGDAKFVVLDMSTICQDNFFSLPIHTINTRF